MRRLLLSIALVAATGCCSANLDEGYVATNERFLHFIDLEVKAGTYKPDATSKASIEAQRDANAKARAVVEADRAGSK